MKKRLIKIISTLTLTLLLLSCLPSCSSAPELGEVKDTFIALIEASAEVNDIFFGAGLPVYERDSSGSGAALYDEDSKTYYWIFEEEDKTIVKFYDNETKENIYLEKTSEKAGVDAYYTDGQGNFYYLTEYKEAEGTYIYDENSPLNYDYVRIDCKYQDVESIMKLAESVYSKAYLKGEDYREGDTGYGGVYSVIFDGVAAGTEIIYARYMDGNSSSDNYFLKSNSFEPFFEEQTTYDYSTMKIVKPSTAESVNVEITAYGRYIDYEKVEVVTGEHTVTLRFVLEDGEWRLDTPTY